MTTATIAPHAQRYAASSRPAPAGVRLTRRGRLVVFLAVLALAFGAFAMFGSPAVSTDTTHHPTPHTVIVQPGQTLWDIATKIAPDSDPRAVVAEIVDLNSLTDPGAIRAGQPLYVPAD